MKSIDDAVLHRLRQLDSCAVSDALDVLNLEGAIGGLKSLTGDHQIAGLAVTVKLKAGPTPSTHKPVHLCARAIHAAGAGDIIVIEHPGIDAGGWGGVLSQAATIKGIEGIVLNGASRDIDEARTLGFPVFASCSTPKTARGRLHETATGVPVNLGGTTVNPGDYVLADGTGVVVVAEQHIASVLTVAEKIAARETAMVAALQRHVDVVEVLGADYENMLSDT